jgi:hypothetical protein
MATPLDKVIDVINTFKSQEALFTSNNIPIGHAKLGVIQAGIALVKDFPVTSTVGYDDNGEQIEVVTIEADLNQMEIYICGLYAFRNYAMQEHHTLTQKAVNFKTINFAVTGLTERAKEMMRIVWWCDTEIGRVLETLPNKLGKVNEMRGDTNDRQNY